MYAYIARISGMSICPVAFAFPFERRTKELSCTGTLTFARDRVANGLKQRITKVWDKRRHNGETGAMPGGGEKS